MKQTLYTLEIRGKVKQILTFLRYSQNTEIGTNDAIPGNLQNGGKPEKSGLHLRS